MAMPREYDEGDDSDRPVNISSVRDRTQKLVEQLAEVNERIASLVDFLSPTPAGVGNKVSGPTAVHANPLDRINAALSDASRLASLIHNQIDTIQRRIS